MLVFIDVSKARGKLVVENLKARTGKHNIY
jgi:hypothetical protein